MNKYCLYYQAHVIPTTCWFFVACLRSYEHLCFDRTFDVKNSIFEFLVPESNKQTFEEIMAYFEQRGLITNVTQKPNRVIVD